ncbi:MAG: hypothetical protein R3B49_08345 [Phycisphaerales bacterium]
MRPRPRCLALLVLASIGAIPPSLAEPISYQGTLTDAGHRANGVYDLRFQLFTSSSDAIPRQTSYAAGVPVVNGLFTTTMDFPGGALGTADWWLEVAVSPPGANNYTPLTPRQPLLWATRSLNTRGLLVESDGDVGIGTTNALARLHIASGGDEPHLLQVSQTLFADDDGFVGISRDTPLTANEYFGVRARTAGTSYGGMFMETLSPTGKPFYGYAAFGDLKAWTYFESQADEWRLYAGGDRLRVSASNGSVAIAGDPISSAKLSVYNDSAPSSYGVYAFGGTSAGVYGYSFSDGAAGGSFVGGGNVIGVRAQSTLSDIIVGYSGFVTPNLRFRVTNSGDVRADGTFIGGGADFAEMLPARDPVDPGDLLAVDDAGQLVLTSAPYQTTVVGVCSTKPAFLGGAISDAGEERDLTGEVPLAVVGIVPLKATSENGPVRPGDLLVASSTPGHAMRASPDEARPGTVVGKALSALEGDRGTIRAILMSR